MKFLTLLLTVSACGVESAVQDVINPNDYRSANALVAGMGAPCWTQNVRDGAEAWNYCAVPCDSTPHGWCRDYCKEQCPVHWTFYVLGGVVLTQTWSGP